MTTHTFCADCGADLGDHTSERPYDEPYEVVIFEGGESICHNCYVARHCLEPIVTFEYTPRELIWPEPVEEFEPDEVEELAEEEELEVMSQLSLWEQSA